MEDEGATSGASKPAGKVVSFRLGGWYLERLEARALAERRKLGPMARIFVEERLEAEEGGR